MTSEDECICLPRVYYKICRKCEYDNLKDHTICRLKIDLLETIFSKIVVPVGILYYDILYKLWAESLYFAEQIAFKGQEESVQIIIFVVILYLIDVGSTLPFNYFRQYKFGDRKSVSLFDSVLGNWFMKYPTALQLPRHLFWILMWDRIPYESLGHEFTYWIIETALLAVTYEIVETIVEALALQTLPTGVLNRERCMLDLKVVQSYPTTESMATARIFIYRKLVAFPSAMFRLPLSSDELMSTCLRYCSMVECKAIMSWRFMERIQSAFLFYLIHSMASADELMQGIGLGCPHPFVLRWIIIDVFIFPVMKLLLTCIRHLCNYRQEYYSDRKTKLLGYDVALESAIGKLGIHQERFPIEDWFYQLMFRRSPTAVQRIEHLHKTPLAACGNN